MIVQELTQIQERRGYLPKDELKRLSQRLNVPLHRVHEVASFYPLFRLEPPPAVDVKVCRDMACHLRGADSLRSGLEDFARMKGPKKLSVEGVSCLGQCDCPVAVSINHHVYRGLDEPEIRERVETVLAGQPLANEHADRSPPKWRIDPYAGRPRYEAVRRLIASRDPDAVLHALEVANLRGMGGAGFPTFRKWAAVRQAPGEPKYVVCNADESEPGTFKDRELMRRTPYLVVEGMVLAGLVSGASRGYLYIRHEYDDEREAMEEAIRQATAEKICGENILGSGRSFPIEIFVSPGGYIQGEESALLEAMEDRRGEPRNKPPFPVTNGLYQKPTVINNVETLSWAVGIVLKGGEWYRDQGINGAAGSRLVSISGDVKKPGVYEVPFGQTLRQLIFDAAGGMRDGQKLKAIAPSGPSGGFLPAIAHVEDLPARFVKERVPPGASTFDMLDLTMDIATLSMAGSMLGAACVVYGDRADMLEQALNCVSFFRNESCGKCVPCRIGSQKLTRIIDDMLTRKFPRRDLPLIDDVAATMAATSICGLGMVAANPIASVLRYFRDDVAKHCPELA